MSQTFNYNIKLISKRLFYFDSDVNILKNLFLVAALFYGRIFAIWVLLDLSKVSVNLVNKSIWLLLVQGFWLLAGLVVLLYKVMSG